MNESVNDLLPDVLAIDGQRPEVSDQGRDQHGRDDQDGQVEGQEEHLHCY